MERKGLMETELQAKVLAQLLLQAKGPAELGHLSALYGGDIISK